MKTHFSRTVQKLCFVIAILTLWVGNAAAAIPLSADTYTIQANTTTGVTLQTQAATAGDWVRLELYVDFNGNTLIDGDDWLLTAEIIVDNAPPAGSHDNAFGDDTNSTDLAITSLFNPFGDAGGFLPAGAMIVKAVNSLGDWNSVQITSTSVSAAQSVSGTLYDQNSSPVPWAIIFCGDGDDEDISMTFTDGSGNFTLQIPTPGDYFLEGEKPGYISTQTQVTVSSGAGLTGQTVSIILADAQVTGTLTASGTGNPIAGVEIYGGTIENQESYTLSDETGSYTLPVTSGNLWRVGVYGIEGLGYYQVSVPTPPYQTYAMITPSATETNTVDFVARLATAWIEGTVYAENSDLPVNDVLFYANRINTTPELQYLSNGHYTASNGQVTVGLEAGDWRVGLCMNCHARHEEVDGVFKELVPPPEQEIGLGPGDHLDVTLRAYYADTAVEGRVFREDGETPAPEGVRVNAWSDNPQNEGQTLVGASINTSTETDYNGYYRLPLLGGTWTITAQMDEWNRQSSQESLILTTDGDNAVSEGETTTGVDLVLDLPINSEAAFNFAMLFSENAQYDPAIFPQTGPPYENGAIYWRMIGVADLTTSTSSPVALSSTVTGLYNLTSRGVVGTWDNFYSAVFMTTNSFPAPSPTWEDIDYTFTVDNTTRSWQIPAGDLQQLAIPQDVIITGDPLQPTVSWSTVDYADHYQIWIMSLDGGLPDQLLFRSAPQAGNTFTYTGDILAQGTSYAIRVIANQKHPWADTDTEYSNTILNRSVYITGHTVPTGAAGSISGQVTTDVTGLTTAVIGALVTVTGTGLTATTDASGNFTIADVPVGTYELTVGMTGFGTAEIDSVSVASDQDTGIATTEMSVSGSCSLPGDANQDGRIGLEDIIYDLQILSGDR